MPTQRFEPVAISYISNGKIQTCLFFDCKLHTKLAFSRGQQVAHPTLLLTNYYFNTLLNTSINKPNSKGLVK